MQNTGAIVTTPMVPEAFMEPEWLVRLRHQLKDAAAELDAALARASGAEAAARGWQDANESGGWIDVLRCEAAAGRVLRGMLFKPHAKRYMTVELVDVWRYDDTAPPRPTDSYAALAEWAERWAPVCEAAGRMADADAALRAAYDEPKGTRGNHVALARGKWSEAANAVEDAVRAARQGEAVPS